MGVSDYKKNAENRVTLDWGVSNGAISAASLNKKLLGLHLY